MFHVKHAVASRQLGAGKGAAQPRRPAVHRGTVPPLWLRSGLAGHEPGVSAVPEGFGEWGLNPGRRARGFAPTLPCAHRALSPLTERADSTDAGPGARVGSSWSRPLESQLLCGLLHPTLPGGHPTVGCGAREEKAWEPTAVGACSGGYFA